MSAHTPGPWSVVDDAGNGVVTLADVPVTDVVVAMLPRTHHANARLIAASPRLVVVLKYAVARLCRVDGGDTMTVSNALDAIHEATGEEFDVEAFIAEEDAAAKAATESDLLAAAKRALVIHDNESLDRTDHNCKCAACGVLRAAIAKAEGQS